MIERKFLTDSMRRLIAAEYIKKELDKAGVVDVDIQRTTLATRISLTAERPGLVIGRKGKNIQNLAEVIEKKLGIENPQIEVNDVEVTSLEPLIVAKWMARLLESNYKPKRVLQRAVSRVMDSGAMGIEISLKGKIMGKGSKARKNTIIKGYLKKAGDSTKNVKVAHARANMKQGVVGVTVKIVPPNVIFPDKVDVKKLLQDRIIEEKKKGEQEEIEEIKKAKKVKSEKVKKKEGEAEKKTVKKTKKKAVKKTTKTEKTAKKDTKKKAKKEKGKKE